MWEILTAQMKEEIYYSLISRWLVARHWGTEEKLHDDQRNMYIDEHIFKESKI